MRLAFYAPMKAPDHPIPSGDRRVGRLMLQALRDSGHEACLISRFRSWDNGRNPGRVARLSRIGGRLADRLVHRFRSGDWRPDLWFTYHLYHKAPDWLGPPIADALDIPYVVAEASYAEKRATGPWALGHSSSRAALQRADAIFALSAKDAAGLAPIAPAGRLTRLPPFLDPAPFADAAARAPPRDPRRPPRLITVAMMRFGDKLESYRILGQALAHLDDGDWTLTVAGDGPAREAVEQYLPNHRTRFLGEVAVDRIPTLYASADLYVWPAINEAYGLAPLEAQATGLPVILGRTGGTPDIVEDGVTGLLTPIGDPGAFAAAIGRLLTTPDQRLRMGQAAMRRVAETHSLDTAKATLDGVLRRVLIERVACGTPP